MDMARKSNKVFNTIFFLTILFLSRPFTTRSQPECPYPCYPAPNGGGTTTTTTPPPSPPQPGSAGNYPSPYLPNSSPPPYGTYSGPPPPDSILPYFPYYYRKPPHKTEDESSATSLHTGSRIIVTMAGFLAFFLFPLFDLLW